MEEEVMMEEKEEAAMEEEVMEEKEEEVMMEEKEEAMEEAKATAPKLITINAGNFFFEPDSITVKAGQEVRVTFGEVSGFHTFVIDELGVNESVKAGKTVTFTADKAGTYQFYCSVGNHRALGMFGSHNVTK